MAESQTTSANRRDHHTAPTSNCEENVKNSQNLYVISVVGRYRKCHQPPAITPLTAGGRDLIQPRCNHRSEVHPLCPSWPLHPGGPSHLMSPPNRAQCPVRRLRAFGWSRQEARRSAWAKLTENARHQMTTVEYTVVSVPSGIWYCWLPMFPLSRPRSTASCTSPSPRTGPLTR